MTYKITETLEELDAGIFVQKFSRATRDVALGVVEHGKKGKVTIELTMDRVGDSSQIEIAHKLSYAKPTKRGKATEDDTTNTAIYVNRAGILTITPPSQADMFKDEPNVKEIKNNR